MEGITKKNLELFQICKILSIILFISIGRGMMQTINYLFLILIIFAGLPRTRALSGIFDVTTLPAAIQK